MRRLLTAAACAAALALVAAQTAAALSTFTVSGPSPFAACAQPSGGGTNYLNTEVEPWVAVDPTDSGHLIAVYQQDRWSNGGARGLMAAVSTKSGTSWSSRQPLPFDICSGDPNYERTSDPWVSFGPDGTGGVIAYASAISFNSSNNNNAVATVVSTDGGATWTMHRYQIRDDDQNQFFNDKESVTADPTRPKTAYVVWDRLVGPANNAAVEAHNFFAFTGPAWLSRTSDGGNTWSAPQIIVPTGQNQQTIDNQIVVAPDGTLYDFFDLILGTGPNMGPLSTAPHGLNEAIIRSTDGGATWSTPTVITHLTATRVSDPSTGAALRTHDFGGVPAVDQSGRLYFAWQDGRFTSGKATQILLTTSTDGGATWSAPAVVSATPATASAWNPGIAVGPDGTVAVYYYDDRQLTASNTTTMPTDVWLRTSPAGGSAFGAETHVTGPFNYLAAPFAGGYFLGDYNGTAPVGTSFDLVFGVTNCANNSCSATTTTGTDPSDIVSAIGP